MAEIVSRLVAPVRGMDCAECVLHVKQAIESVPGVKSAQVYLGAEKAVITIVPGEVALNEIRSAVASAGYSIPAEHEWKNAQRGQPTPKSLLLLLGGVFIVMLGLVVSGELLGWFDTLNGVIPWWVWAVIIGGGGYPVFQNVIRAALRRKVISHTLMSTGVVAAVVVGEWVTAVLVVLFMRIGDYIEQFTSRQAKHAIQDLSLLAPETANRETEAGEQWVPIEEIVPGDIVVVRPGERIPVDGWVISGQGAVDQAAITGEPMPAEAASGTRVFSSTLLINGSLRVETMAVGAQSTFGQIIQLVEEAEGNRADVQRFADRFSAYFLPIVAGIALLSFFLTRSPISAAAVLVVACSCSFALATPVAMLASIGAGARNGLVIKGGKYIEVLDRATVLLVDKTGTLTLGKPTIQNVLPFADWQRKDVLALAAAAEWYSEHPLARAVLETAQREVGNLSPGEDFLMEAGKGVQVKTAAGVVRVGSYAWAGQQDVDRAGVEKSLEGFTLLWVSVDGQAAGVLAAADPLREEIAPALVQLKKMGIQTIELLTGDNEQAAKLLAEPLKIQYRANLLPQDKIRIVKEYQQRGKIVVMVGDGINDAPSLAQADIGIAMGVAGADIAVEAAHIALMQENWLRIPELFALAKRTMRVVRLNIVFTGLYNLIGLTLAALGFLPPSLAAAAQSLPDIGILLNSARLVRYKGIDLT